MVTTYYPPYHFGGDAIFVQRLVRELAALGHHVEVIHCRDSYRLRNRGTPKAEHADPPGVVVHGLESGLGLLSPLATQQTGRPIGKAATIRRVLDTGFDVIHYHNISLVGGPGVLLLGEGIKLYTMHEYWLVCPTHLLFRYNRAACVRPHCLTCGFTYRRPPQWWRKTGLLEKGVAATNALIAPSRFSQRIHAHLATLAPIVHIPNFAPARDEAVEADPAPESRTPYFLFAGRLEKHKGVQTIIPFFRRWGRAPLVIAGNGSYERHLRGLAAGSDRIRFIEWQDPARLQSLVRGATALLVPSINYEVFPLVIIEAFAQRTPAVVRDLGSMPEIIEESGAGFTFGDDAELAAALDRLLDDPSHRDALGERGYQAYQRNWSPQAHLARYFQLIAGIAGGTGRMAS